MSALLLLPALFFAVMMMSLVHTGFNTPATAPAAFSETEEKRTRLEEAPPSAPEAPLQTPYSPLPHPSLYWSEPYPSSSLRRSLLRPTSSAPTTPEPQKTQEQEQQQEQPRQEQPTQEQSTEEGSSPEGGMGESPPPRTLRKRTRTPRSPVERFLETAWLVMLVLMVLATAMGYRVQVQEWKPE